MISATGDALVSAPALADKCPFCENPLFPYWRAASVWRCTYCGLLSRNPIPSEADLAHLYDQSWQRPDSHEDETGGTDLRLARTYARKLADSLGLQNFAGKRILEFGAGKGSLLMALLELKADAYGIEPFGYEHLRTRGFRVFRSLDELPQGQSFDGIVSLQVIEHLRAPWIELSQFHEILAAAGWVYVSTINANGLNARLCRSSWREVRKRGHLLFFTARSLEVVLQRCGYRRCQRLRWFLGYSKNPLRRSVQYGLQLLGLDGELRYLALRS